MKQSFCLFVLLCLLWKQGLSQHFADSVAAVFMRAGNVSGLFIAVVKDTNILYQQSLGFADLVKNRPVTPATCFELGSVSKAFCGDMIYGLQQKKQLHVSDPLTKYFPDAPKSWSSISIEQLLQHTSGIQNYLLDTRFHAAAYFTGNAHAEADRFLSGISTDSLIKLFYSLPVEFPPGSSWAYSNTGYILLGKIIEKVTGQPFFDYTQEDLLSVGMYQTMPNERAGQKGCLAKGYLLSGNTIKPARVLTSNYAFSAGAWAVSGADMISYLTAIHTKTLPIDKLQYDWRSFSALSLLPFSYQAGRFYTTYHGLKIIFHNGGTAGFSSSWIYVPEKNCSIIVLINRQDYAPVDQFAWNVLAHYEPVLQLPEKKLITAEANAYENLVKRFVASLASDSVYTENFTQPLTTFMKSENGKGLWRWIFNEGLPLQAHCVDTENIGRWRALRFRLPMSGNVTYRLTLLLNEKKEITQILWY